MGAWHTQIQDGSPSAIETSTKAATWHAWGAGMRVLHKYNTHARTDVEARCRPFACRKVVSGWKRRRGAAIQEGVRWASIIIIISRSSSSSVRDRARHRYKATSRTKRDGHKPRQGPPAPQPCAAAPLPSMGLLLDTPVPRAGFSRVPCTDSPGGRLSAERQWVPKHAPFCGQAWPSRTERIYPKAVAIVSTDHFQWIYTQCNQCKNNSVGHWSNGDARFTDENYLGKKWHLQGRYFFFAMVLFCCICFGMAI